MITNAQRSWINVMLRNNLGDAKVAYFILNHGLPKALDLPLRRQKPHKDSINNMLEELMTWHASLSCKA